MQRRLPQASTKHMNYESEHLPSELLAAREKAGCCFRLTIANKHVLPSEYREFSMFNPEQVMGGYDERFDEPAGVLNTLPPDPSPFAEDDSENAIVEVLQRALDEVADVDRDDPAFEDKMRELYPVLAKAMFSGGDEFTHRMTMTTEAFLIRQGNEWELSYTEPTENGMGETTTRIWLPGLDSDALTNERYDITDGGELLPEDVRDKAVDAGKTVRIQRKGEMENLLVLTEGKRVVTAYHVVKWIGRAIDLCVYARRLDWKLDPVRGGTIFMDYIVELRGMDQQRTVMRLDLRPFAKSETEETEDRKK